MIVRTDKPCYFSSEDVTGIKLFHNHLGNIYLDVTKEGFPG